MSAISTGRIALFAEDEVSSDRASSELYKVIQRLDEATNHDVFVRFSEALDSYYKKLLNFTYAYM